MAMKRLGFLLAIGCLMVGAGQALAIVQSEDAHVFDIALPETPPIVDPAGIPGATATIDEMTARYGGTWQVALWDPLSRSPELVLGSGVELAPAGLLADTEAAETADRFVAGNADLLGADASDLMVENVVRGAGKVAVHYGQRYHGIPVIGGRVRTVFTETGRLFVFGSSFHRGIDVNPAPAIQGQEAEGIARAALPFNPATDRVLSAPELLVLPVPGGESGVEYHLVWRMTVATAEPYGAWVSHVDAHSGQIIWRYNDVHNAYSGTVTGVVDEGSGYCAGPAPDPWPLSEMTVTVTGAGTATTDINGDFSIAGTGGNRAVTCQFDGTNLNVNDVQFGDAVFNGTIQEDVPLAINFTDATPSRRAERDCFYWINATNRFITGIDPTWSIPKHNANVNVNSSCNANWTTWTMNFFREGGGCANTGIINDVMAHEYGHGIQYTLLGGQGGEGLGEGNSDISGSLMIDDSVIGRGFYLNNCTSGIRDCENTLRYPGDVVGQPIHSAGRVICGFNWDSRQALELSLGPEQGKATIADLWHFSRKVLRPQTQPDQVLAYFITDDDDGNVNNGTPHYDELCEGAMNHGFSCPEILIVQVQHTPPHSTTDHVNAFTIEANVVAYQGAIEDVRLFYRIDGGAFTEEPMTSSGPDTYSAEIPPQAQDASVEYYIYSRNDEGFERTSPPDAPNTLHQFFVATVVDELEINSGWTVGAPGDNATTGIWVRVDPNGTAAQPEDDYTPAPGVNCFVTGQGTPGGAIGENDVDGGTTSLLTPVYDLSQATQNCKVAYYRWYSNNRGSSPNADNWVVDVSNDGGVNWTSVENINPPDTQQNTWVPIVVDIVALFGTPDQVQLRFRASDLGTGSIVEAAVDDLVILTNQASAAVSEPAAAVPARFAVGPNQPNPFNPSTTISYSLPERSEVAVTVFDVSGRQVRTLVRAVQEAGEKSVTWNGLDDGGQSVSSGVYYYRVEAAGQAATRKMVLVK